MRLDLREMAGVDLGRLRPFIREDPCFYQEPGKEHYRLLAYLSTFFSGRTIIEIGTHRGDSAMALSYEESNRVESFDIVRAVPEVRRMRRNVAFHQEDLWDEAVRKRWEERLLGSALVFIDVDPHEGTREFELVSWLEASGYRGLIVLDDIWYFRGMRESLWYKIRPEVKADATRLGHWSGTGLVSFTEPLPTGDRIVPRQATSNWTLVTGYFDLTKRADANPEIKERPPEHYLDDHAASTLALDKNLVVFCEPSYEEKIWAMRPKWLRERTRVVTMSFDEFPLTKYFPDVVRSRQGNHCSRDPRNTASYYLFCMARFAMVKRAATENWFGSDRFAWVNICIERMGFKNLVHLDEALSVQREKFSTCYIDYVPKETLASLPAFFGKDGCRDAHGPCGRCSMCSGFFTGSYWHMTEVANLVEQKFVDCIRQGYGHADEQLLALVHADAPSLFEWYPGDYGEMVTNYSGVYERPENPLHNLIRHSFEAGDLETCGRAAALVWKAYSTGACELRDTDLSFLLAMMAATGRPG